MLRCLGIIQVILLTFCEVQGFIFPIFMTPAPPYVGCIKGCVCTRQYRYGVRTVDCSKRNLEKVPIGSLGSNDYLVLRGNNIKKIKHADFDQYSNLYGLDLRDNPIENVPSAVFFKLHGLRELLLTANQLHYFAFHGLTELTTLRIEGNQKLNDLYVSLLKPLTQNLRNITILNTQIKSIKTHAIAGMKALQIVDLRNNQIETIGDDAFQGSPLRHVLLSHNRIKTFPKNFQNHKTLQTLDISFNKISSIDANAFQGMDALSILCLNNNEISELSQQVFSGASRLSSVYLQRNQLKSVPTALLPGKCSTLRFLDLSDNEIDKFEFLSTTNCPLYTFKLRGNPLTRINLSRLSELRALDISKNCGLNFTVSQLGSYLSDIDLSECCLTELPTYFQRFNVYRTLSKLNLHRNKFTNFTMTFPVDNLNISSNQLENISFIYQPYYSYSVYDLSNNQLSTITKGIRYGTMRLAQLILRNNSFTAFNLSWITNIQTLDLSYNKFESFDSTLYRAFSYYYIKLNLRGNRIKQISRKTFSQFRYLREIDMSENRIAAIDSDAFNHPYLVRFNLSGNKLANLSTEISPLRGLQILDLSNNMIDYIDENAFQNMNQLKEIFIKNNLLQMIPMGLTRFTENYRELVGVDLSGNKLNCSCNVTILLSFYLKIRPIGNCKDASGTKSLQSFITSFDELAKSKCNLCPVSPCQYRGHCIKNDTAGFHCDCHEGYTGRFCEDAHVDCLNDTCSVCKPTTCNNGGTCIEENGKPKCHCQAGYQGTYCQYPSCSPNPCKHGGSCFVTKDSYKCHCTGDYFGDMCGHYGGQCNPSVCNNRGQCVKGEPPTCYCQPDFSGANCENEKKKAILPPSKAPVKVTGGDVANDMSSSTVAVIVLVIILVFVVVVLGVLMRKHAYFGRFPSCRKSIKDDKVDLSQHF